MKLAKYLADYLDHEHVHLMSYGEVGDVDEIEEIIQQGIEAYVSTSDVTAIIVVADSPISEVYI